jgi:pimeloyl-ACP methyl ester carboxylesterase
VINRTIAARSFTAHDGTKLVADVGGPENAPAIVMLHGGGQTRHSWSGAATALVDEGYRIINMDQRGHGDSGWSPDGVYRAADRVKDIETVLAAGGERYAFVGASLGGMVSMCATANSNLTPDAVVLVDVVPALEREGIDRILEFMNAHPDGFTTLEDAAAAVARYYPERDRPANPSGLRKNLREAPDGRLRWHWDPGILSMDSMEEHEAFRLAAQLVGQRNEPPILLVRGLSSDVVSDRGVASMRQTIPRVEVFDVAEAGHMVAGDRNDPFNAGTIDFLRRVMPPG